MNTLPWDKDIILLRQCEKNISQSWICWRYESTKYKRINSGGNYNCRWEMHVHVPTYVGEQNLLFIYFTVILTKVLFSAYYPKEMLGSGTVCKNWYVYKYI